MADLNVNKEKMTEEEETTKIDNAKSASGGGVDLEQESTEKENTQEPRAKLDTDKLTLKVIKELILMSLTYRISYKNLSKLLNAEEEAIRNVFKKIPEFASTLHWLDIETINEDEIDERVAYINGFNYLQKRKKLLKQISIAKKRNDVQEVNHLRNQLKKHFQLIDDSIVNGTLDKPLSALTEEERDAIAKYRVKYFLSKNHFENRIGRAKVIITKLEQELGEKNPVWRGKIERLNNYWETVQIDYQFGNKESVSRR